VNKVIFAKCPLKGWFVDHWAVIIEREDEKYLSLQFLTQGLEIQRLVSLELSK
jgi:hypothetical protein